MAAKKRTTISLKQADQLEDYLSELIEFGEHPGKATKDLKKSFNVPIQIAKRIVDLTFEVRDAADAATHLGPVERNIFEDVVAGYEALDGFLNRSLEVVDPKGNSRRRYKFRVGD